MKRNILPWRKREASVRRNEDDSVTAFSRWTEDLFEEFLRSAEAFPAFRGGMPAGSHRLSPSFEIAETENALEVKAEVPGMDEKDMEVTLDGNVLTVSGKKTEEREKKRRNMFFSERRFGTFRRTIPLPTDVRAHQAKASFRKGVLSITLPKAKPSTRERGTIPVEVV